MSIKKVPPAIVGTVLKAAREMRGIKGDQQPDQWTAARYTLADDLASRLYHEHGIRCRDWSENMTFRVAN